MPRGVRWLGESAGSGFGDACEAYLSALRAADVPVTWTPLGHGSWAWGDPSQRAPIDRPEVPDAVHADLVGRPVDYDVVVVHAPPLWHEGWRDEEPGRWIVACTAWEPDVVPADRVELLNRYDAVLVPSRFNRDVLVASGVRVPVRAVPHIARRPDPGEPLELPGAGPGTTVFVVIGPWITRKALADTISAYLDAFTADDDVLLVVKTTPEDHIAMGAGVRRTTGQTLARMLVQRRDAPRVHLAVRHWPPKAIDALHARADCFVSLSRGEGWGLTAFDAGIAGTPVVVTGWGGTPEFLPEGYPYLVDFDLVPTDSDPKDDWIDVAPDRRWARARRQHAVELLRTVHRQPDVARAWGARLREHIVTTYSPDTVTPLLLDALSAPADEALLRRP
jgi:glycosyltransferase involved in cell wall biosynthesis